MSARYLASSCGVGICSGAMLLIGVVVALRVIRKRAALAATDPEDNDLMDV